MIDTATQEIHYTPIFHVLAQFSRTIRPGDFIHSDVGIKYLRLNTDHQQAATVRSDLCHTPNFDRISADDSPHTKAPPPRLMRMS